MASPPRPSLLHNEFINGVYLPAALLVFGTAIVKKEWVPYAFGIAAVLGGLKIYLSMPRKVLDPNRFQSFMLREKTALSHNTAIYRFSLPRKIDILGLPIGQHISLAAVLPPENKEVVRSYTPISSDATPGYFDLLIKAYPQGNISRHVSTLKIGDTISVKGPKGAMVYRPNMVQRFGMVAGGTGITPMLQIVRAIVAGRQSGDTTEVDLLFANVATEDILLKEDLDALAKSDPGFRIYYTLDKPPENWKGYVGFITPEMLKETMPPPSKNMKILMCGPPKMVSMLKKHTESMGYEKARPVSKLEDQVFAF